MGETDVEAGGPREACGCIAWLADEAWVRGQCSLIGQDASSGTDQAGCTDYGVDVEPRALTGILTPGD